MKAKVNHAEAYELAVMKQEESNLARAYLDLHKALQTARTAWKAIYDDSMSDCRKSLADAMNAALADQPEPASGDGWFDLVAHLHRQRQFSERTFGPGTRTNGVLDHIRKELHEIEQDPTDLEEWIDVVLLALDGAWRAGNEPEAVARMLDAKMTKNEARQYPDWRTVGQDKAIEHIRTPPPASEP